MNKKKKVQINLGGLLRKLFAWGVFNRLPDKEFLELKYFSYFGRKLDLSNPNTFNEKIQWLKLNDRNPNYIKMVDKYEAKQYVAQKIGKEYIIPTIGVWDSVEDINFDSLPNQFVLKTTHGSGGVVVCKNKQQFDFDRCKKMLNKSLHNNYYLWSREWPYKMVKPRVIAEEFMIDNALDELRDYKILCFHGKPENIMVCTGRAQGNVQYRFFDLNWNFLPLCHGDNKLPVGFTLDKPKRLKEMIEAARLLSQGIDLIRVDFYEANGKVYFGELTFYPDSGLDRDILPETDSEFGKKMHLSV